VLSSWLVTREGIAAGMMRQLNAVDGTLAKDSGVTGFSGTPQGVEAQMATKEVNINAYQKRIEYFFAEWSNKALRMYLNAMGGVHDLTVDEETRRKLFDISAMDIIKGNKITIDFDALSTDVLKFQTRSGSLILKKEDQERAGLQATLQPLVQNLMGWSEQNKAVIENEVIIPITKRLLELSDTDISKTLGNTLGQHMAKMVMQAVEAEQAAQQAQIDEIAARQAALENPVPTPPAQGEAPAPGALPLGPGMEGTSPSSPSMPDLPTPEPAGQQMKRPADLLTM
jgi:hypothetical protein